MLVNVNVESKVSVTEEARPISKTGNGCLEARCFVSWILMEIIIEVSVVIIIDIICTGQAV